MEKPVIYCPDNQTASADVGEVTTAVTWPTVLVVDNSGPDGIMIFGNNPQPGSRFPIGATQVLYWAVDLAGNGVNCGFYVIVKGRI